MRIRPRFAVERRESEQGDDRAGGRPPSTQETGSECMAALFPIWADAL